MSIKLRIKQLCKTKGITLKELANITDTKYRTLQNYVSEERSMSVHFLRSMNLTMGVSSDWMLIGKGEMFETTVSDSDVDEGVSFIPQLSGKEGETGNGHSGLLSMASVWLQQKRINPEYLYILGMTGDSMAPLLNDDDFVLFDRSQTSVKDGKTYVLRIQDQVVIRILQATPAGVMAMSKNKAYDSYIIQSQKIEQEEVKILGRVVASFQSW